MKSSHVALSLALSLIAAPAFAQDIPAPNAELAESAIFAAGQKVAPPALNLRKDRHWHARSSSGCP